MANEELKEYNIEKVMNSAVWLFQRYGVEATTFSMVARKAGVSVRSVQRYFTSKEVLAEKIIGIATDAIFKDTIRFCSCDEYNALCGFEQIKGILETRTRVAFDSWQRIMLIVELEIYFTRKGVNQDALYDYREMLIPLKQIIRKALLKGMDDGSIKKDINVDVLADMLSVGYRGILQRFVLICSNYGSDKSGEAYRLANEFIEMVFLPIKN